MAEEHDIGAIFHHLIFGRIPLGLEVWQNSRNAARAIWSEFEGPPADLCLVVRVSLILRRQEPLIVCITSSNCVVASWLPCWCLVVRDYEQWIFSCELLHMVSRVHALETLRNGYIPGLGWDWLACS